MIGMICSILAGILMGLQGVFNTRVSQKIGSWETNTLVQGSGLLLTVAILLFTGSGGFKKIKEVNSLYLIGGFIGVFIIYTVMQGINLLGPTYSIAIILIAQLLTAACIDIFGLFDTTPVVFHLSKILGIFLMIAGIVLFKFK